MKRVCVFCGSSPGSRPVYAQAAQCLGQLLACRGLELVYGGGRFGLMGILAKAVLEAGGSVIGVLPRVLADQGAALPGLTELRVAESMHERKALMADLSDGFIALPGGYGTLDEFCEILTWAQLGLHGKPCGLLNVAGFFDTWSAWMDHAVAERFLRSEHRALVLEHCDPGGLLDRMEGFVPAPILSKWLGTA